MITPAQGYILGMAGNSAMCVALPRKQTTDIYLNGTQIQDNDEADAGWRFMGISGALACGAVYLADKNISNAIASTAMFVAHPFMENTVKTEMRWLNAGIQAGVGALALKALIDKK
jgi:hypothetical protein